MKKVIILLATAFLLFFSRESQAQGSRIGLSIENDSVTVIVFSLTEDEEIFYVFDSQSKESTQNPLPLKEEQSFIIPESAHHTPHKLRIFIQRKDGVIVEEKSFDVKL